MNSTIRLSFAQQEKLITAFQSADKDLQKDALAVFCEHELTIHDVAAMARVSGSH